jgi:Rieske Fe-S protein
MGGPLHEGTLADGCATCPWHGSQFRLYDGSVVHGPATGPQPAYDARRSGDRLALRRRPKVAPPVAVAAPAARSNGQNGSSSEPADALQP